MEVGFNLEFMIGRLRQAAQCLFSKRVSNEVQVLQHQITLLQDSLAVLTAYQEEMISAGGTVLEFEHGRSLFDSLFDWPLQLSYLFPYSDYVLILFSHIHTHVS